MPRYATKDARQAKALDETTNQLGRRVYTVGNERYAQYRRNNDHAPKRLHGNQRLSAVDGTWAVVASSHGAATAFSICFALAYLGLIPKGVGKVLCLGPDHVVDGGEFNLVEEAGIPLLYDDLDEGVFPGAGLIPTVAAEMFSIAQESYRQQLVWHGNVPQEYIDYSTEIARRNAFDEAMMEIDADLKLLGSKVWGLSEKLALVEVLSYGLFDGSDISGIEPTCSGYAGYKNFPCKFEFATDAKAISEEYRSAMHPMKSVLRIWASILHENCLMLDLEGYDPRDSVKTKKILDNGRLFGVDSAIAAVLECGVPLDDVVV